MSFPSPELGSSTFLWVNHHVFRHVSGFLLARSPQPSYELYVAQPSFELGSLNLLVNQKSLEVSWLPISQVPSIFLQVKSIKRVLAFVRVRFRQPSCQSKIIRRVLEFLRVRFRQPSCESKIFRCVLEFLRVRFPQPSCESKIFGRVLFSLRVRFRPNFI